MSSIEDALIVALTRLKAMLEQQPPGDVLHRLVHRRRLLDLSREALVLHSRYAVEARPTDSRKTERIAELRAQIHRLQGARASCVRQPP